MNRWSGTVVRGWLVVFFVVGLLRGAEVCGDAAAMYVEASLQMCGEISSLCLVGTAVRLTNFTLAKSMLLRACISASLVSGQKSNDDWGKKTYRLPTSATSVDMFYASPTTEHYICTTRRLHVGMWTVNPANLKKCLARSFLKPL